ncbi:MAG TPA: methyltransferase domain-containing protein [Ktedonobacterales bacterium]|jgi:ubiquinone/menaquinone biosynthesis C-methylase UbiE|nr:methyltransferase domain-containing protein [Ktedonobacterales bacterium]
MDTERQPETAYVLGHSDQELERLISQARLYEPFTMQFFHNAGISEGMRVLDVGCGTGDVSFLAARMVGPNGQVVGVDRAEIAVETARQRMGDLQLSNVSFVVGDASEIAFEEPCDAVVGRFVLQWCPDPIAVLRQLTGLVRPGGVIAFQEPDWYGYHSRPPMPTWDRCARWIPETIGRSGGDPYLGVSYLPPSPARDCPHQPCT